MLTMKFSDFFKGDYKDHDYELYLLKDSEGVVMYIGIARESVWHRWFEGGTSHMECDSTGNIYGKSYIGEVVERRLPDSWSWTIELWTKEDCLKACNSGMDAKHREKMDIESIEPYMISKFMPLYNVIHGGGRHEDPLTTKSLDDIYKDIFG